LGLQKPAARLGDLLVALRCRDSGWRPHGWSWSRTPPIGRTAGRGAGATRAAIKDALTFCLDRLNDPTLLSDRIRIAIALLPFQHCKVGEIGKKERAQMEAERITGRFARPVTEDEAKWAKLLRS
jgi:hypothetical protein